MSATALERTVFIISDGTGITAETFSHSVLSQFESVSFKQVRVPFIDTVEKADGVVQRINRCALDQGVQPIVFTTLVNPDVLARVKLANALFLDLFGAFVEPLEVNLGIKSSHSIGKSHKGVSSTQYRNRIEAINFSLAHDDGQFITGLAQADVILVGVSRCGKTPTSLYLAMQYGVKAANFPLIPEDFERGGLPSTVMPFRSKLFGLTIQPERLTEVRNERRPESKYASLEQCRYEVAEAERLMRRESIPMLSTTTKSIEEISTTVLQEVGLDKHTAY
ncbi:kinase/pyrophosphorylase [Orrella sp. NBD-18]|uniref:Putative phosphoenolpyruvate synthase regulatory protein n=1 Tax=Sheuella amnicola TaxID=2707330 RepID=A0A6B2QVG8_9BURK|nr:pyruvate, water dikinase regulatory protein [Sheuella amnicola]NDY81903.1 kinase/pyrophosphorylase [Sheuella amnicola]HBI82676.1 phosphoenolpyruvate synthase regulatory protein [Alcaligenaceae bacterium]